MGAFFDRGLPNYGIISTVHILEKKKKRSAALSRIRQYDALLVFSFGVSSVALHSTVISTRTVYIGKIKLFRRIAIQKVAQGFLWWEIELWLLDFDFGCIMRFYYLPD